MNALALSSVFVQPYVVASLVAAPFIYLGLLSLGRWLKKGHRVELGLLYHLFCLALAAYVPLKVIYHAEHPFGVAVSRPWNWRDDAINHFGAAVILLGVLFLLALLRRFYWQKWFSHRHQSEAPKFLQQICSVVVFTISCVLVARWGYGAQVDAFLTGSGIVAVVLGFAMQETLANIVSGVALQIGKPFKVGDWLIIEMPNSQVRAEVVELNWRSTRLRTNDDIYLDIPNKTVTSSTITNLCYPTRTHSNRIRVGFEYDTPPNVARDIIRRATEAAANVVAHPPVKVFLKDFGEASIIYEIKYSIDDEARFNDVENEIKTNLWYEARRAGVSIPQPKRMLQIRKDAEASQPVSERARVLLAKNDILAPLSQAQQAELLRQVSTSHYGRGEHIIRQGAEGASMFIILEGQANVLVHSNGKTLQVASLQDGEAFGEMCLLTGEPRTADVVAHTDCEVWELRRSTLQPILQENEALAERLSLLLAKRKLETEGIIAASTPPAEAEQKKKEYAHGFMEKIKSLFEL